MRGKSGLVNMQSAQEWCTRACRWLPAIAGLAALLSLVPEVLSPGRYFFDQAYCLQAAVRLAHGQGLTGCPGYKSLPLDIAVPNYARLYLWPPGYSVLVASLLRLGIPLSLAASLIKVVAYVGGWIAGAVLARRVVPDGNWVLLFFMAALPFTRVVPLYSQAEVLVWATIPLWMLAVMSVWSRMRIGARFRDVGVSVCALGLLTAAAIMFRWASLFLAPAAAICIVLGARHYRRPWIMPTIVVLALSLGPHKLVSMSNAAATGGRGNLGDEILSSHTWTLEGLLSDEPLLGLLGRPSGLYDLLANAGPRVARLGSVLVSVPVILAMAWALAALARRTPDELEPAVGLTAVTAVTYGVMCTMLLLHMSLLPPLGSDVVYGIRLPRYYTIMSLPALLIAVQLFACLHGWAAARRRHWRAAVTVCACVLVASGLWAAKVQFGYLVKVPFRYGAAPLQARQVPERLVVDREIARQAPERVMLFSEEACRFLAEDTIPAYWPPPVEQVPGLYASRPTLLFVVLCPAQERWRHALAYPASVEIIRRFHLQEIRDPSLTDAQVYCGIVGPSSGQTPVGSDAAPRDDRPGALGACPSNRTSALTACPI